VLSNGDDCAVSTGVVRQVVASRRPISGPRADRCTSAERPAFVGQAHRQPGRRFAGVGRTVDEHGETSRRHVPRLGRGGAERPGEVTTFPGGASCVRATAFNGVGGYYGEYFYAMEETDLAWRLIDAGWTIRYAPEHPVLHPRTEPSRHPRAAWHTARNRTWLAYRLLPLPLAPVYLTSWLLITLARRSAPVRDYVRGVGEGWRTRSGPRRPLRWRTIWRLTRLGRPPIV